MSTRTEHDYTDYFGDGTEGVPLYADGGDWDQVAEEAKRLGEERIVVNMGPAHPSTHGVLRLVVELEGETVTDLRPVIGYLHTGIEKNMEFKTWTQGFTFITRMDYLLPLMNECAYALSVERLLGLEGKIPERANVIRVLMMELTRISSHMLALGPGGMELGATSVMEVCFRLREHILAIIEDVTGLRMNVGYIRVGGVANDVPENFTDFARSRLPKIKRDLSELQDMVAAHPIVKARSVGVAHLDLTACMALGVTGPILRSAGYPSDLRKDAPYCGYETYDFDVVTKQNADGMDRLLIRMEEPWESLKIIEQCLDRLDASAGEPVMVADKNIAWPARLLVGPDGQGNSLDHIKEIMGSSMESLIHHFKLVTEGFKVPPGQAFVPIEGAKGHMGVHVVSMGGTRPHRVHMRDSSFNHVQALPALCEGGLVADVIVGVSSIDPVLGGVDR